MSPTLLALLREAADGYRTVTLGGLVSQRPFMRAVPALLMQRELEGLSWDD